MSAEAIGLISGVLVIISAIPYAIRTYQKKIQPSLTSWSLWALLGLVILVTYDSSGAEANIWPAVFGFTNPTIIAILVRKQQGMWLKPDKIEQACLVICVISLGLWLGVRKNEFLAQYALYLAMIADGCAAIPTITRVWKDPTSDRPFAWGFFAIGYGMTMFAIEDRTFVNFALPTYMFLGGLSVSLPLAIYRWKNRIGWKEWI